MKLQRSKWLLVLSAAIGGAAIPRPAAAAPPVGTISPFTGNLATSVCVNPEGLTVDLLGHFYTGSAKIAPSGIVCEFESNGTFKKSFAIPAGPGGLVALLGVHFQGLHTVFALDFADTLVHPGATNGRVLSLNTLTGVVTTIASGFAFPNGMADDLHGRLYVTDSFKGTITRMNQDGSDQTVWASGGLLAGDPTAALPIGANGIAFDFFFNSVYVAVTSFRRIVRIPVTANGDAGTPVVFADGPTIDVNQSTTKSLLGADGITFDLFGNLYLAANAANEIQVLSPSAHLVARYANTTLPLDVPATPLFVGFQLYFTNLSLFDGGVQSSVAVLQAPLPGLPPL